MRFKLLWRYRTFISRKIDFMVNFIFDRVPKFRFLWIFDLYWMYCPVTILTSSTSSVVGEKSRITDPQFPYSQFVSPATTYYERTDPSLGFSTWEFLVPTSCQSGRRLALR